MRDMTIGGLARAGGVGVETVRYYQRRGLLCEPPRGGEGVNGGIRRYGMADLSRLRFVRAAQAAGFSLEQIGELLALDATADRAQARALAEARVDELDQRIATLQEARDALHRLAVRCAASDVGSCPIIGAFEDTAAAIATK